MRDSRIETTKRYHDLAGWFRSHGLAARGRVVRCPNPDHEDKHPSGYLYGQRWWCFVCGIGGDVLDAHQIRYQTTLETTLDQLGPTMRTPPPPSASPERTPQAQVDAATGFWHQTLMGDPQASNARQYLRSRGYDTDIVQRWELGWHPPTAPIPPWAPHIRPGGYVIPLHNPMGETYAVAAWEPDGKPRYRLPKGYAKSAGLYGLHIAASYIHQKAEDLLLVEGYHDVHMADRAGYPTVALLGTTLHPPQVRLLQTLCQNSRMRYLWVMFDGDPPGRKAAHTAQLMLRTLGVQPDVCRVDLPSGLDPGEMFQHDRTADWVSYADQNDLISHADPIATGAHP